MTPLETFCRQVRSRSNEHRRAFRLLNEAQIVSQQMAILRQELDSMIRIIYLLSIDDMDYRNRLVQASISGEQWRNENSRGKITDRKMVELANQLQGWVGSVYRFGCAFIHLSSFHSYQEHDPMSDISDDEKQSILQHMRNYHFGPTCDNPTLQDLIPYFPSVFDKIASNLECYVKNLEEGRTLDKHDLKTS